MPEPRLLSKRHGVLLLIVGLMLLIALRGPPRLLAMPVDLAALPLVGLDAGRGAAVLLVLAALVCAARFLHALQVLDAGLFASLLLAAVAATHPASAGIWMLAAAATLSLAVLYAGYRMAFIDPLTALPNRRALDESLSRLSGEFSLAMVDIDHFKSFNDTHGHAAGDVVLRQVAADLRRASGGVAYRYGGEEFCVIYRGLDARAALERIEHARSRLASRTISVGSRRGKSAGPAKRKSRDEVEITISAGVAERNAKRREPAQVLKAADQALYQAKSRGRNRVERGR